MIDDDEALLRHVHPDHVDPATGLPLWVAFRDRNGISVDRESLRSASDVGSATGKRAARIRAGRCRELGFDVRADPLPGNPVHALIVEPPGLSHGRRRLLALALLEAAEWPA